MNPAGVEGFHKSYRTNRQNIIPYSNFQMAQNKSNRLACSWHRVLVICDKFPKRHPNF